MSSNQHYESKVIQDKIAYWKFLKDATAETFMNAFVEFNSMITNPNINFLLVNVEMENAWGKEIQDLWIKTGNVLDQNSVAKWAVVTQEFSKELTIKHLIKGGGTATRSYDHLVAKTEEEAINWLLS